MKKNQNEHPLPLACLMAQVVWLISAIILLLVFSIIAVSAVDPKPLMTPLALCAAYLSSCFGGIAAVRLSGDGILSGFVSGVMTVVFMLIISTLPIPGCDIEYPYALVFELLVVPAAIIGSIIGKKRTNARKKLRKLHK